MARSERDRRRRSLGQNFLRDKRLVAQLTSGLDCDELVVDFGAGRGGLTVPLALGGARVIAIERDPILAAKLSEALVNRGLHDRVTVVAADLMRVPLPREPYRVVASPPFNLTTAILRRLLDDVDRGPRRADLIVQWEVAVKRCSLPPTTLLSSTWGPWWRFRTVRRISREAFRPVPKVDAAWLAIEKRNPPLLPPRLAGPYAEFVRSHWR